LSSPVSFVFEILTTAHFDSNLTETQVQGGEGRNSLFLLAVKYHRLQFSSYIWIKFRSRSCKKPMKLFHWILGILDKVAFAQS